MKKTAYIFLLVLSFSFSVVGCGCSSETSPQPQTVVLNQSDSGRTVSLHQNQIITLSLQGNGSTGYTWDVVPGAESILAQQGNPEFAVDSNAIGSGGTYKFTFKATAPGTAPLNLIYHRSFEAGVAPLKTFGITVTVGSSGLYLEKSVQHRDVAPRLTKRTAEITGMKPELFVLEVSNGRGTQSDMKKLEEHKLINVDGCDVHYFVSGKEHNESVIFIHPAFSDHRAFDKQIQPFAKSYKVIAVDLIGHGLSKQNKSTCGIDASARHINEILGAENSKTAHIVGVSLGSLIGQYFAMEYPQRVASLVSLGGYYIDERNDEIERAQWATNFGLIIRAIFSMDSFRMRVAEISTHTDGGRKIFFESASLFERKSFMSMRGLQMIVKNRPRTEPDYRTLILTGEFDIELAKNAAEEWHKKIVGSQYGIINGAGHCANMDKPEEFNERVIAFINDNS